MLLQFHATDADASGAASDASSVLARLRHATATQHQELEAQLQFDADLTRAQYTRFLLGFHSFMRAWQPLAVASLPMRLHRWVVDAGRLELLEQDLRALGLEPLPPATMRMALPTRAAAMGSLYVVEGSALGAQVIAPRIARHLRLDGATGAAYFHATAASAAQRWRDFRFLLEHEVNTHPGRQQAAAAAVATFTQLRGCLQDLALQPAAA
jgi:heme oxygenase